ncbi:hypothetical protein [Hydrocoleum sp. CS-953]|uniref:hypothetical protein n=1 Tax=Hydrocoleum sp. CS-953 TaxID=1671698 RepID=UPI001179FED2|nr:hypothetical protein [Hydrocoleum sp. CS-953]
MKILLLYIDNIDSRKFARDFSRYLLNQEVSRYFLKWSARLLPPFDFLPVFVRDENFPSIL